MFAVLLWALAQDPSTNPPPPPAPPGLSQGPFRGHADAVAMHLWARATAPGTYTLELQQGERHDLPTATAAAHPDHGLTLHWVVGGLAAAGPGPFGWRVVCDGRTVASSAAPTLRPGQPDSAARARLAFGSCAEERKDRPQPVWAHLRQAGLDGLVLLGDTPYIDSTKLAVQRRRRAEFFAHPEVAATLSLLPTWVTWDDHDYATNDRYGDLDGTDASRRAFVEHHAQASYGDGQLGIYTRFRSGPLEVFLLDTRTFADREESPLASGHRSLLGAGQLRWLQQGLSASTAPFKVLACGMVWNGAVRPGKPDTWATWQAEADGLWRWLGAQRIGGVVLVGGDLHVTRLLRHRTRDLCGYDLLEFVTSPLAQDPIPANAGAFPDVLFDAALPHTWLTLEATLGTDGPQLAARFHDAAGSAVFDQSFPWRDLSPR